MTDRSMGGGPDLLNQAKDAVTLRVPDEDYLEIARSCRGSMASAAILGLLSSVMGARAAIDAMLAERAKAVSHG